MEPLFPRNHGGRRRTGHRRCHQSHQGTELTADQFLADCRARAGSEEIFQQSYMCNPMGAASANIVDWSAIERRRADYEFERVRLEAAEVAERFGEFNPSRQPERERKIAAFLHSSFPRLLGSDGPHASRSHASHSQHSTLNSQLRLGFDVAASGQGDLAVIYIDEVKGPELWLAALFTCRTEDWHFLKTVLFYFLENLHYVQAAGDATGLGCQICWEAANDSAAAFSP